MVVAVAKGRGDKVAPAFCNKWRSLVGFARGCIMVAG